jgi:TonB family protein
MRLYLAALGVATLIAADPASAADPLQPTGKWVVEFADAQCVATRNYGPADKPFYLVLKAPPLGSVLQLGVIRQGPGSDARQIDGEIRFDENAPLRTNLLQFGVQKLRQQAVLVNLPLQSLAPMRQATTLHIRVREDVRRIDTRINLGSQGIDVRFALTQMGPLLKTLDSCVADLKKVWNVKEGETGPAGSSESAPSRSLAEVFSNEDYPAVALAKGQSGDVAFALLIDEQGKVADCTVVETSGAASLDAQSCGIIRSRGRFLPAKGPDGKPIKSAFLGRIRWRIAG